MPKRLLPYLLLTAGLFSTAMLQSVKADVERTTGDAYYTFYDQRISLVERSDQIAVKFSTDSASTRGLEPAYVKLQRQLNGVGFSNTRELSAPVDVEVSPLGEQYALIKLSANANSSTSDRIQEELDQSYIESKLPVLSRQDEQDSIVVTPEIVVSFEPGTSEADAKALLERYDLTLIRPLQFSQGRYLVSAPNLSGQAVLSAANQLNNTPTIQSATPNFVQSLPYQITPLDTLAAAPADGDTNLDEVAISPAVADSPFADSLLPLQWYLNSESLRPEGEMRTDVHAIEAWEAGSQGENVVVAVIDSLIQWDHPDLKENIYTLPETATDRLPGEVSGWDFSSTEVTCEGVQKCAVGDADTRISDREIALVRPDFQKSIALPDEDLLAAYPDADEYLKHKHPNYSVEQRANYLRRLIQNNIAGEFHGTWSAGVIAASPAAQGMVGVAPAADILPIRVFGLGGSITVASMIEALGYAAARNVDVVNFSLGGLLPSRDFTDQVFSVLDDNPDMVIVASAGNDSVDGVSFPAAVPGVVAVGATGIEGHRTFYSSYGAGLGLVAPGGETSQRLTDGMLTAGGTWVPALWEGISQPERGWGPALDPVGQYVSVQGTSFSAPAISGVMALMKSADPNRQMSREQLIGILADTASYDSLEITRADANEYRLQAAVGFDTIAVPGFPKSRPSGITGELKPVSAETYFYGSGLVNAAAAVAAIAESVD